MYYGPSPRARGNPRGGGVGTIISGSIPACAGKPGRWSPRSPPSRVHPRVRGETYVDVCKTRWEQGPSPRARGNQTHLVQHSAGPGSIPACAGKPTTGRFRSASWRVHPRVRGETIKTSHDASRHGGPSPRARGNRRGTRPRRATKGSIPACAGKPRPCERVRLPTTVHPRVRGETIKTSHDASRHGGPSPRARGNRRGTRPRRATKGSIPACAGKPRPCERVRLPTTVHPRVRGETRVATEYSVPSSGPSPRARGNRDSMFALSPRLGSIPACAGKPSAGRRGASGRWVHPRVRGETFCSATSAVA